MRMLRYDYHVYYATPKASPICHFFYGEFRDIFEMEKLWKKHRMDAYVIKVVDTQTGETVYERAQA